MHRILNLHCMGKTAIMFKGRSIATGKTIREVASEETDLTPEKLVEELGPASQTKPTK